MTISKGRARTRDAAPKKHEDEAPQDAGTGTAVAEVIPPSGNALPQALLDMVGDDLYGAGSSSKIDDSLVPMAKILHTQSPELKPKDPLFVADAAFGDVIIRAFRQVIPCGDNGGGMVVVPCATDRFIDEWTPRNKGGGLVAKHRDMPPDAREHKDPQTGQSKWTMPNGNELIDCRYFYVLLLGREGSMQLVIPFSSTGHTVARGWNTMMRSFKAPNGRVLPSWCRRYHLGTVYRKNDAGDWYTWQVSPLGPLDPSKPEDQVLFMEAKQFHDDIASGGKVVDMGAEEVDRANDVGSRAPDDII